MNIPMGKLILDSIPEDVRTHIEHLEMVRRDFIANVSHELRTPLTVIRGYLESLLSLEEEEIKPWKKVYQQMYQHSIRMENLIKELLLLSHLERDEQNIKHQRKIQIAHILQSLCDDAESISGESQHVITLKADPNLAIDGVEEELKSLFSNIIINAIKYTPPKGTINVEWYLEEGSAIFKVIDSGIGIAKEHIPRITERFYRVDNGRSRENGGTGLGLAIVKHVLIRHQGELRIKSKEGIGSTFICLFPRARTSIIGRSL
jgi:two-component system, OmpR family, phosphate regulon sensor histidine kinase PhoR